MTKTKQPQKIYLSSPHIGELEQQYIREAFETNWVAPLGPHVDAFERELAEYVGIRSAVALSSGTSGLQLALRLLNVVEGDIVFCSSLTFVASVNPVLYQGGTPVFIDSEPDTWNMSPLALERALCDAKKLGKLPKAVIVVNLYGQSANMDSIVNLCNQFGVPIIEDAAESLGATYKGKASGTFGRFGIYSFNGNKIITTSGGGMLVSDEDESIEKARFWATQARDPARHYQHSEIGYNFRMSNVLAAIGRGQLKVLEDRVNARRQVYERYSSHFSSRDGITFMPESPTGRSTRWITAMTLDPELCGVTNNECIDALAKFNIESRPVWKPMHLQPLFRGCTYYSHSENESVSDRLFNRGICLPSGSNLSEEDQNRVIEVLDHCLTKVTSA